MDNWYAAAFGNASGKVKLNNNELSLTPGEKKFLTNEIPDSLTVISERGKFADTQDSFIFVYRELSPEKENFSLKADTEVKKCEKDDMNAFSLTACDTDTGTDRFAAHRNMISAGKFRTLKRLTQNYGIRTVAGYTDSKAENPKGRILNAEKECLCSKKSLTDAGEKISIELKKTGSGFDALFTEEDYEEEKHFEGSDFLTVQDRDKIYIGFAVAGMMSISFSSISLQITEGSLSNTDINTLKNIIPDYPFSLSDLPEKAERKYTGRDKIYASPDGSEKGDGSKDSPLDIKSALSCIESAEEIILLDGTYSTTECLYLDKDLDIPEDSFKRIRALNRRKAVINGEKLNNMTPLMLIDCSNLDISGIIFENSPGPGIMISGHGNLISDCEARNNKDTGILICSIPGTEKSSWPSANSVVDCDSHHNRDILNRHADGFGAKLRTGRDNSFIRCIAHHNIDDGFDLYTKRIFGKTGPVVIEGSIAYCNGTDSPASSRGSGFKLGGEKLYVRHEVLNCLSYENRNRGFDSNSNSLVSFERCTSWNNGDGSFYSQYSINEADRDRIGLKGCISSVENSAFTEERCMRCDYYYFMNADTSAEPYRDRKGNIRTSGLFEAQNREQNIGFDISLTKRNITFLISTLGGGGAERVCVSLANEISKRHNVVLMHLFRNRKVYPVSPRVTVMENSRGGELNPPVNPVVKQIYKIPLVKPILRRIKKQERYFNIMKLAKSQDAVISFMKTQNFYNAVTVGNAVKIMSERNDPMKKGKKYYNLAKFSYSRADRVVFQSEKVKRMFSEKIQDKSVIIPNPVKIRASAGEERKKKIVTVGRLVEQKNHRLLIDAFSHYVKVHQEYELFIYGDGPLRAETEEYIENKGLTGKVILPGFKENIHEEISDAQFFVLSSDFEGLSNALMEAMAMGHACISTDCTGSDELITDGINGLLVPIGDSKKLTEAMLRLSEDSSLRKKLAENAEAKTGEYTVFQISRKWEKLI